MSAAQEEKSPVTVYDQVQNMRDTIANQRAEIEREEEQLIAKKRDVTLLEAGLDQVLLKILPPKVTVANRAGGFSFNFDRSFFDRAHEYEESKHEAYHFGNIQDDLANALLSCEHVYGVNVYYVAGHGTLFTKIYYVLNDKTRDEFDDMVFAAMAEKIKEVIIRHGYLPPVFDDVWEETIAAQANKTKSD